MGLNWPELKLDSGSSGFVPKTMSEILTDLSMISDDSVKAMKLNNYVNVMQEELRKIDAFKRQLPLCTRLLSDAVERLEEERVQCLEEEKEVEPVMVEFLPLKGNSQEEGVKGSIDNAADKRKWMSSAQLWTAGARVEKPRIKEQNFVLTLESSEKESDHGYKFESPFEAYQTSNCGGGSFLAFKGRHLGRTSELLTSYGSSMLAPVVSPYFDPKGKRISNASFKVKSLDKPEVEESSKKQRRCWSPELHRLFVDALEQLGGAHKATPKQIKEKMHVDGMTADEIKSHLQKYRLHLHKVGPRSMTTAAAPSPSTSQSYVKGSQNTSGSPDGPFYIGESSKGISVISLDEEEDVKSENHSWRSAKEVI